MMSNNPLILTLNRNKRNSDILTKFLEEEGYNVVALLDLPELDAEVEKSNSSVDLVLMDISGFNKTIWESCERLREIEVPFLVISPHQHAAIEKQSRETGAHGVVVKPLVVKELLLLIKSLIKD